MDVLVEAVDAYVAEPLAGDALAAAGMPVGSTARMAALLTATMYLGTLFNYLVCATLSYVVFFRMYPQCLHDPEAVHVRPGQIRRELLWSLGSMPVVVLLTAPIYVLHGLGYSRLYRSPGAFGYGYLALSAALFVLFTDLGVCWIHRLLHQPPLYAWVHQRHHSMVRPTPFSAMSFNPIDGFVVSLPYHLFAFALPLNTYLYFFAFVAIQWWCVSVHDRVYLPTRWLGKFVLGAQHHADHHVYFKVNYSQYLTVFDWLFGTLKADDPRVRNRELAKKDEARAEAVALTSAPSSAVDARAAKRA